MNFPLSSNRASSPYGHGPPNSSSTAHLPSSPKSKRSTCQLAYRQRRYANIFPSLSFDAQLAELRLAGEPKPLGELLDRRRALSSVDLPSQTTDAIEARARRQPPISPRRARRFCTDFGLDRVDSPPIQPPSATPPEQPAFSPTGNFSDAGDDFSLTSDNTTPLATPSCTMSDASSIYENNLLFPQPPPISPHLRRMQSTPSFSRPLEATEWRSKITPEECMAVRTVRADGPWAKHSPDTDDGFDPRIPETKILVGLLDSAALEEDDMHLAGEALVLADDPRTLVMSSNRTEKRAVSSRAPPPLPSHPPPSFPTSSFVPASRVRRRSATLSQLEMLPHPSSPPPATPARAPSPQKEVKVGRIARTIRKVTSMSFQPQPTVAAAPVQRHSRMNVFSSEAASRDWEERMKVAPWLDSEPVVKPRHRSYAPPPSQKAFLQTPFTHRPSRSTGAATLAPPPSEVFPRSFMDLTPERRLKRQPSMSKEKMKKLIARASGVLGFGRKKA